MSAPVSPSAPPTAAAPAAPGAPQTAGRRRRSAKQTSWMAHVKATMRANKGLKLKQVLKLAKKTYKKLTSKRGGGVAGGLQPSPLTGGRGGKTRRSRRGGVDEGEEVSM